ncbi:hypothetical protein J5N97_011266 [Dioscorea zingiberensis]|uniref:Plus3 domain-containing protein n=1 Tax=Dioscorea zingiberensis TaxID=325984 RepID=A0A9D5HNJ7_9LILI|nr:hypothetical protein J5N97_011266 [Dioscorea zingiberensis]
MAAKSDALNELRAKRMKQQDPEAYHKLKDSTVRTSSISTAAKVSPPAKPKTTSGRGSSLSDSGDSEGGGKSDGEEGFPGESKMGDNLEDDMSPGRLDPLKFEDIKDITIRRSKLAKWCMEPFFENVIVGCFVRIGIGKTRSGIPRYRLCMVRNVDATDPDRQYKLENWTTCKWLNCVWGNETSAARWQMIMVSDSPPLEEEFKEWVQEVERTGGRMPTAQEVQDKKKDILKTNNFEYTAATVKQMLQEKKSASSRRINIAAEKDKLRKEMEVAQSRRDEAEMERIRARLKELENMSQQSKQNAKAVRLAEMNRKNRAENFKNASGLKPVNTSLKAGEAGYDPFSRRWTRSRNYYISKPEGTGDEVAATADNDTAVVGSTEKIKVESSNGMEAGVVATAAALEAAAGAGKLVDTSAPVDQGTESNSLHNFELPISLAGLQKFGGAQGVQHGFLARKQRIEATVGYMIPDNDSRRHPLTLTVSDYKRRRGLL